MKHGHEDSSQFASQNEYIIKTFLMAAKACHVSGITEFGSGSVVNWLAFITSFYLFYSILKQYIYVSFM